MRPRADLRSRIRGVHGPDHGERACAVVTFALVLASACPARRGRAAAVGRRDVAPLLRRRRSTGRRCSTTRRATRGRSPRELVAALDLRPGRRVADLGAGTGYLSRHLSAAVGPEGTVLAVETEPNAGRAPARARRAARRRRTSCPILASADNPRLPAAAVDLILDRRHLPPHRRPGRPTSAALRARSRPDGRVAIVDWQKRDAARRAARWTTSSRASRWSTRCRRRGYTLADEPDDPAVPVLSGLPRAVVVRSRATGPECRRAGCAARCRRPRSAAACPRRARGGRRARPRARGSDSRAAGAAGRAGW